MMGMVSRTDHHTIPLGNIYCYILYRYVYIYFLSALCMFLAEMELVDNFVTRPDPTVRATGRNHSRPQADRYFERFYLRFIEYF